MTSLSADTKEGRGGGAMTMIVIIMVPIPTRGEEVLNGVGRRNSLNIKWDRMESKRPRRIRFYFNDNIKY